MTTPTARSAALIGAAAAITGLSGCLIVVDGSSSGWDKDKAKHKDGWNGSSYSNDWSGKAKAKRSWTIGIDEGLVASTDALRVLSEAGDVKLVPTDGPATIEAYARGPDRERLDQIEIIVTVDEGVMVVEAAGLELDRSENWNDGISIDLVIEIPQRDGVTIDTSAGDVYVAGMAGELGVASSAGDVEVDGHAGPAAIASSAGDIDVHDADGPILAETSAGDISLSHVGWPIEAATSAGDIDVLMLPGFHGHLHASTTAGSVSLPGSSSRTALGPMSTASATIGSPRSDDEEPAECVFVTSAGDISVSIAD
ncbi:MAG: DUF4097 family beta strand repeat-containing protein [Planctomycetota bacterium]